MSSGPLQSNGRDSQQASKFRQTHASIHTHRADEQCECVKQEECDRGIEENYV